MAPMYIKIKKYNKLTFSYIWFTIIFIFSYSFVFFNHIEAFGETYTQNPTLFSDDFNIAVAGDWGCEEDTIKTAKNIQSKNPELVISAGDMSYEESADCWFEIIEPFMSKMTIAMGDHEYSDTTGGVTGVINQYLKPLNLPNTYYSFDMKNLHFVFMDPYIDYKPGSVQYQFIEHDLRNAASNPKIDWTFVVESIPIYTSPAQHPADSNIRDIYHPLFDKYGVDLVFTSDNHNYQRTFPLIYNSEGGDSSNNPIIADNHLNYYNYNDDNEGVVYLIVGTGGRSLYEIEQQAHFVAKQEDKHFGFLNINIENNGKTLFGKFIANDGSIVDQFRLHSLQDKILVKDNNANNNNNNNNIVICDKLDSFVKTLMDKWKLGKITDEQAVVLGEQAKKLMIESSCFN